MARDAISVALTGEEAVGYTQLSAIPGVGSGALTIAAVVADERLSADVVAVIEAWGGGAGRAAGAVGARLAEA